MRSVTSHAILAASIALVSVIGVKAVRSTEAVAASAAKATSASGERDDCDGGSPIEGRRIFVRENCYSCHGGLAGGATMAHSWCAPQRDASAGAAGLVYGPVIVRSAGFKPDDLITQVDGEAAAGGRGSG